MITKEEKKEYMKKWRENNKEEISIKAKKQYQNNKEEINEKHKEYRKNNKDKLSEYAKEYRENHKEEASEYQKEYRENNKEELDKYNKEWRENNKDKLSEYTKEYNKKWRENNREKINKHHNDRMKTDINYKLAHNLRSRLNRAIKNNQKSGSAVRDLGCSIPQLRIYLESKFQFGMNWDNWNYKGWHIDHIIPLSSFDLENREELLKAVNYINLQPLWWHDNISKGDKII